MNNDPHDNFLTQDNVLSHGIGMSELRMYSVGVVAANKKLSSMDIEVCPLEHFSFMDGELTDNKEELKVKSENYNEEKWELKIDTTPSIKARWLSISNTNRKTAPDVRRGELVIIWQFGDADEYWWTDFQQSDTIRRKETIVFAISNNKEENDKDDPKSTYWIEWSTHRKLLHIHTSKNDEEPFAYDIQLDTKEGKLVIQDDDDNYIFMDSKNKRIKLHNKDKSLVDIDKKEILIESVDKITLRTKDVLIDASKTIKLITKDYTSKSATWKTTVPNAIFSTNVTIGSSLKVGGNITGGGNGTIDGNVTIKGNSTINGMLKVNNTADITGNTTLGSNLTVGSNVTASGIGTFSGVRVGGNIRASSYSGGHHG